MIDKSPQKYTYVQATKHFVPAASSPDDKPCWSRGAAALTLSETKLARLGSSRGIAVAVVAAPVSSDADWKDGWWQFDFAQSGP